MNKKYKRSFKKGGKVKVTYYDFDGNPIEDINEWGKSTNTPTVNPNIIEPLYNSSPAPTPVYTPNKSWFINPDGSISLNYNKLANDRTAYGHSTYDNYTNRLTAYDGTYGYNHAVDGDYYADGGIHIKKSHRGLFTQWAKDNGFSSVQSAASHVLANKDNYSTHVVQMANFAKNATKFHHKKYDGGGPKGIYGDTNGDGVLDEQERYNLSLLGQSAPNVNTDINTDFSLSPNNNPFTPKPFPKTFEEAQDMNLYNNPESLSVNRQKLDYLDLNRPLQEYPVNISPQDLTSNIKTPNIDNTPVHQNTGFGYGATSASAIGSVAKQAFNTADNIRRGIIGLRQDLAKGSLGLVSALSTNINQPEQKKRSIRQAIDDGSYNQDFGRLYYADGGNVTNYNINTPNISQIATRPQGANAEVEEGEVIKLPDGSTIPVEGNNAFKHYENNNVGSMGTPVNIPDNSFIYSDRKIKGEPTKLNKQVASDILNKKVKKSMSMGDIAKKLDNTEYDKILNNVSATPIQKRTAAINKEMNTVKLKQLADYQESFKLLDNTDNNKFPDGGPYLTNADIPEGYAPDIAQGYYDENGNYINAQPTDANYRNPRYMFLKPDSSELPWYYGPFANNNQVIAPDFTPNPANIEQDLSTGPKQAPTGSSNIVVNQYQEQDSSNTTKQNRRSLSDLASNINWNNVGKSAVNGVNNAIGWAGNVLDSAIGALPGLVGVLSDVPVNGNPIDLQYLPNARQNNSVTRRVQDQIATKFNERAKFMNPALQQAYDAQLVANTVPVLEEAAATDYQNYLRQQDAINNANIQTSNKEDMINNQDQARVNELLMRKRDSNIRDIQTSLQNAYTQRVGAKKERNTLALLNQLSPNYQYNPNQPNQGVQFVYDEEGNPYIKRQDASGKIFYEPAVTGTKKDDRNVKKKRSIKK